jgi:hypothetical protein
MRKQYRTEDQPEEEETTETKKEGGKEETTTKTTEAAESMVPAHLASILRNAMNVQKAEPPPPSANDGGKSGGRPKGLDPMEAARQAAMNITNRVGGNKGASLTSLPLSPPKKKHMLTPSPQAPPAPANTSTTTAPTPALSTRRSKSTISHNAPAGPSRTAPTLLRSSTPRKSLSRLRVTTTHRPKDLKRASCPSCIFWWRARRRLLSRTRWRSW